MFGAESYFNCPCCDCEGVTDLGITNLINIKGIAGSLALMRCPECNKQIAFRVVTPKRAGDFYTGYHGNSKAISCVENTISAFTKEELNSEETVKEKVLSELKSEMSEEYVEKHYVEIVQLIEIILVNKAYVSQQVGYDISKIDEKDITNAGVMCY